VTLGYAYSAPPIRLKDRAVGGLLANSYAHGFLVAISVEKELSWYQIGTLDWGIPLYFVLTVAGTYILTTIPDIDGDRSTGKRTVTVALGRTGALIMALIMLLMAASVAYLSSVAILFYLAAFASFMVGAAMFLRAPAPVLLAAKAPLLFLTLLAGYWYPAYFFFVVALIVITRIYYRRRFGIVYPKLT
jgi:4-hydroxybenzoate polyprenyltransferase